MLKRPHVLLAYASLDKNFVSVTLYFQPHREKKLCKAIGLPGASWLPYRHWWQHEVACRSTLTTSFAMVRYRES